MTERRNPVLIVGGSGVVGSQTAHLIRRLHPEVPIALGARDAGRAAAVAEAVGGATSATGVDLDRPDLGQPAHAAYSAVAVFVKDETLNSMRYAQARGLPYVSVSSGTFEIGPEVARFIHAPSAAPILMASQWLAGAATMPALNFAAAYESVEAIHIGVLLDEEDMGGPAAYADYERITGVAPAALTVTDGLFTWLDGDAASASFRRVDGVEVPARAYSPFDIISLSAATGARSIRLDLALAESSSRRRGQAFSTEIVIAIEGTRASGERARSRHEIVHPAGQGPLTALGVALAVERLLGLDGSAPVPAGLYLPEVLLDPAYLVRRMQEFGAEFRHDPPRAVTP